MFIYSLPGNNDSVHAPQQIAGVNGVRLFPNPSFRLFDETIIPSLSTILINMFSGDWVYNCKTVLDAAGFGNMLALKTLLNFTFTTFK